MRILFLLTFTFIFLFSCLKDNEEEHKNDTTQSTLKPIEIPAQKIEKSKLTYNNHGATWTLNGILYSGCVEEFYANGTLKEKFYLAKGKKQNESLHWYEDGHLKFLKNYHQGKWHGEIKEWTADSAHKLLSHLNYFEGKIHGIQKIWYPTGEIHKVLQLDMGQEKGLQKAYRKNGVLYANYEARNGRIFGLKKAELCYGLKNEDIEF